MAKSFDPAGADSRDGTSSPSNGPGRQLKGRLQAGEVLLGGMLTEYARPSLVKLYVQAGFDFLYIEYEEKTEDTDLGVANWRIQATTRLMFTSLPILRPQGLCLRSRCVFGLVVSSVSLCLRSRCVFGLVLWGGAVAARCSQHLQARSGVLATRKGHKGPKGRKGRKGRKGPKGQESRWENGRWHAQIAAVDVVRSADPQRQPRRNAFAAGARAWRR